jgi:hypothetical protein
MPDLARFLFRHAAIGFGIAALFVGMLVALDAGGLRTLMRGSDAGLAEAVLLTVFVGLTFGSVQMGIAVWQAGRDGSGRGSVGAVEPPDDDKPLPD